jgi:hypothetical protein
MKKSLRFLVILFLLVNQHVISNAQNEQYARRVLYSSVLRRCMAEGIISRATGSQQITWPLKEEAGS